MFGPLGIWEILLILGIALLIFGPKKLPEIGRTLGRSLGEFRRATTDLKKSIEREIDQEEWNTDASSAARSKSSQPRLEASVAGGGVPAAAASGLAGAPASGSSEVGSTAALSEVQPRNGPESGEPVSEKTPAEDSPGTVDGGNAEPGFAASEPRRPTSATTSAAEPTSDERQGAVEPGEDSDEVATRA